MIVNQGKNIDESGYEHNSIVLVRWLSTTQEWKNEGKRVYQYELISERMIIINFIL